MTPLSAGRTRDATELLVAAFDEDPYFRFLAPEPEPRRVLLRAVMGSNVVLGRPRRAVRGLLAPDLRGLCVWFEPGAYPVPLGEQARARVQAAAGAFARGHASPRVIASAIRMGELVDEAHPAEPHFYLQLLAVAPEYHGRGIGSSILIELCGEADHARRPTVLETSNPKSARLYRRFGFETVRTTTVDSSPPVWTMRRDPEPLS